MVRYLKLITSIFLTALISVAVCSAESLTTSPENVLKQLGGEAALEKAYRSFWKEAPNVTRRTILRATREIFFDELQDEFLTAEVNHYIASGQLMARTVTVVVIAPDGKTQKLYEKTFQPECGTTSHNVHVVYVGRLVDENGDLVKKRVIGIEETIVSYGCPGHDETEIKKLKFIESSKEVRELFEIETFFHNRFQSLFRSTSIDFDSGTWARTEGRVFACTKKSKTDQRGCLQLVWNKELTGLVQKNHVPYKW